MSLSPRSSFISDNHEEAVAGNDDSLGLIADGPSQGAPTPCMLLELPVEVIDIIFKFQAHKDRLSVATTCNDLLKLVEAFSRRHWREIGERGDHTWEARVRDATGVIETEVPLSLLEIPQRFLLARAYRTLLYSITDPRRDSVWNCHVLPGGETAAVAALDDRNSVCNVWDLNTKECIRTFSLAQEDEPDMVHIHYVWFCGDYLVVEIDYRFRIYSISGELLCRPDFHVDQYVTSLAGDEKNVFFTLEHDHTFLFCLNMASALVRKDEVFGGEYGVGFGGVEVSEGRVITLPSCSNPEDNARGLYVLDYDDGKYSVHHFFPGRYCNLKKARDDPTLFVANNSNGRVDVLKFVDGRLSCTNTFTTDTFCSSRPDSRTIVKEVSLVSDSKIYIQGTDEEAEGEVVVYCAVSGERLSHSIRRPPAHTFLQGLDSNGNELLCFYRSPQTMQFPTIQAFPFPC